MGQGPHRVVPAEFHGTAQHHQARHLPPQGAILEQLPEPPSAKALAGSAFLLQLRQLRRYVRGAPQPLQRWGTRGGAELSFVRPQLPSLSFWAPRVRWGDLPGPVISQFMDQKGL